MGSEKFCFRWNYFENNISQAFNELRDDKDFFDVTLACDDEQIQAHKVILSACSPFFRNILRRNPHQHPLIYIKGVKYNDLQSVLNFMYHGEVNVPQEELNSFLTVAEELRVKGLTKNNQQNIFTKQNQTYSSPKSPPIQKTSPPDRELLPQPKPASIQAYTADDDEIQEVVPVKSEPHETANSSAMNVYQHHKPAPVQPDSHVTHVTHALAPEQSRLVQDESLHYAGVESSVDYGRYAGVQGYEGPVGVVDQNLPAAKGNKGTLFERNKALEAYVTKDEVDNASKCNICGLKAPRGAKVKDHLEAVHFPNTYKYECEYCLSEFYSRNAHRVHTSAKHRNR